MRIGLFKMKSLLPLACTFLYLCVFSSALSIPRPKTGFSQKESVHSKVAVVASTMAVIMATLPLPANAAVGSVTKGEQIFQANCASCHSEGKNVIAKTRTLEKEALEEFLRVKSADDISTFVRSSDVHRGALLFAARMNDQDYSDVATFVYDQAMEGKW